MKKHFDKHLIVKKEVEEESVLGFTSEKSCFRIVCDTPRTLLDVMALDMNLQ